MKESNKYINEEKAEEDCWSAQDEEIKRLKQIIMDIEDYATINFDETLLQLIEGLKDGKNRRDILYGKT